MRKERFPLGRLVATPGALQALEAAGQTPLEFLVRHQGGDWGVVHKDDAKANDRAIEDGSRIFSAYLLSTGTKIWVITTAADDKGNRESTCVLLPSDY